MSTVARTRYGIIMTCLRYVVKCQLVREGLRPVSRDPGIADETFHALDFGFMISRDFFHPLNKARARR